MCMFQLYMHMFIPYRLETLALEDQYVFCDKLPGLRVCVRMVVCESPLCSRTDYSSIYCVCVWSIKNLSCFSRQAVTVVNSLNHPETEWLFS